MLPLGICVLKVNEVAPPAMVRLLVPLSCKTSPVPASPEMVPLIVYVAVLQATATLVTLPVTVPLPLVTVQVWVGFVGCVRTVTLYVLPLGICVLNVNEVAPAAMVRLLVPLSCRTRPVPARPEMVPLIV